MIAVKKAQTAHDHAPARESPETELPHLCPLFAKRNVDIGLGG